MITIGFNYTIILTNSVNTLVYNTIYFLRINLFASISEF